MNMFSNRGQDISHKLSLEQREVQYSNSSSAALRTKHDVLVLEARLRQSLVTVRSLGSRGLHVAAMETFNVPTFWSRWCQHGFVYPGDGNAQTYLSSLNEAIDRTGARVLITSADADIDLIRSQREQLERRVRIALAKESALGIALDKEQTLDIAKQLGLGIPRAVTVESGSEVKAALSEIGLPAVVKPVQSWAYQEQQHLGVKCKLVTTPEEARAAVEYFAHIGAKMLFQQFLSGRREALSFLYANGRCYARFAQWAKRTAPPLGGTSVLRQSIAIPSDIGEQAERLVREIDLEGYSEIEFRRDSAGYPYLMEINPRLSASVELAVRAGVDFPYLLYQWANGDQIDQVRGYHVGSWIRYLRGDLATTVLAIKERGRPGVQPPLQAICDFFTSFFLPTRYDYLDWKDPIPALAATIDFAHYTSQAFQRNFSGKKVTDTQ